jgi:hypothetical protein
MLSFTFSLALEIVFCGQRSEDSGSSFTKSQASDKNSTNEELRLGFNASEPLTENIGAGPPHPTKPFGWTR